MNITMQRSKKRGEALPTTHWLSQCLGVDWNPNPSDGEEMVWLDYDSRHSATSPEATYTLTWRSGRSGLLRACNFPQTRRTLSSRCGRWHQNICIRPAAAELSGERKRVPGLDRALTSTSSQGHRNLRMTEVTVPQRISGLNTASSRI